MFKWTSKTDLKIENARLHAQCEAFRVQVSEQHALIVKLERMIDHERDYIDRERARADRAVDNVLQQSGLPALSNTTREDLREDRAEQREARERVSEQMGQIWAESLDDCDRDDAIDPAVKELISVPGDVS